MYFLVIFNVFGINNIKYISLDFYNFEEKRLILSLVQTLCTYGSITHNNVVGYKIMCFFPTILNG